MEKNKLFESIRGQLEAQNPETIYIQRAPADGDTSVMGNVIPVDIAPLDVVGHKPIWELMGVEIYRGVSGTYTLPFEDPIIGAKLAELAAATGDTVVPSGTVISPKRFTVHKTFTLETLASASDSFLSKMMEEMVMGCDRIITTEVYRKINAGAANVVTGADISKEGFDLLQGAAEVENAGAFFSHRDNFFTAKSVPIDPGSGLFLTSLKTTNDAPGVTYDGVDYWFSNLFAVTTPGESYVDFGDPSKIHVADYEKLEIIIDKYTLAGEGKVIFTVNKLADVALKNPDAFARTENLTP